MTEKEIETPELKDGSKSGLEIAGDWIAELERAEKEFKSWRSRADKIIKRYRDERLDEYRVGSRLNILWSNVQTSAPALYSRTPKPYVERRFKESDPISRAASEILERCLIYTISDYGFHEVMKQVRDDYLLAGRGTAWVRYKANIQEDELLEENACVEYVHWSDFVHQPARFWSEVDWVARKWYPNRKQLNEFFGEELGEQIPLNYSKQDSKSDDSETVEKKACIYEIWDKPTKKVYYISKSVTNRPLMVKEDPLGLKEFFPCPKPLFATTTTDTLVPVPDFCEYQDLAEELDETVNRISILTTALKVAGVYDASLQGIEQLVSSTAESELIPVENWRSIIEVGGIDGAISWLPVGQVAQVITALSQRVDILKQQIYEVTGISDIVRGASDPRETATAQQIKGRFSTLRIADRQAEIQRFARDLISRMAEIIAEKFSIETLAMMSGIKLESPEMAQMFQMAVEFLRIDRIRSYMIEIETDSTIAVDEQIDKQARIEYIDSVGRFIQQGMSMAQALPSLAPALTEMILFASRGFKAGRQLESSLEASFDRFNQELMQQQQIAMEQSQQPAPEMPMDASLIKLQAEMPLRDREIALKERQQMMMEETEAFRMESESFKLQMEQFQKQVEAWKAQKELELEAFKLQNIPQNELVQSTIGSVVPEPVAQPAIQPLELRLSLDNPRKKIAIINRDPVTNLMTSAEVVEVEEEPTEVVDGVA